MIRLRWIAATALAVTTLSACGSSSPPSAAPSAPPPASATTSTLPSPSPPPSTSERPSPTGVPARITIKDFRYAVPATIAAGATVQVTNDDTEAHTVTADAAGGFDVTIPPGASVMLTAPAKAGRYPFHCTFHGNMHGTLTVA